LRDQWERRRAIVPIARDNRDCAAVSAQRFEFVTTQAALFPGWPIVRAAYVIESEVWSGPPGEGEPARLVYEETRVVRLDGLVEGAGGVDANGGPATRRLTVLEGCARLQWEVWTPRPLAEPDPLSAGGERPSEARSEAPAWSWRPLDGRTVSIGELPAGVAEDRSGKESDRPFKEDDPQNALRESEESRREEQDRTNREAARPKAVRLKGTKDGREFEWSLVVEALR
jgi:hypothetical protein